MKTNYLNQPKKGVAVLLAVALGLTACKKDQSSLPNAGETQSALAGTWKLSDMMQVNNPDGQPQNSNGLAAINYTSIQLSSQGGFVGIDAPSRNEVTGNWDVDSKLLTLKKANGGVSSLNVVDIKDHSLTLAQYYPATGGKASGTIYYTLNK